jgi:hypothetical protein
MFCLMFTPELYTRNTSPLSTLFDYLFVDDSWGETQPPGSHTTNIQYCWEWGELVISSNLSIVIITLTKVLPIVYICSVIDLMLLTYLWDAICHDDFTFTFFFFQNISIDNANYNFLKTCILLPSWESREQLVPTVTWSSIYLRAHCY